MAFFVSSAKQNIIVFGMLFGMAHSRERKRALKNLIWFHYQKPELFTANCLLGRWSKLRYEYTDAAREGVRNMIRMLPDGSNRGTFATLALGPCHNSKKSIRRWHNVFAFSAPDGM